MAAQPFEEGYNTECSQCGGDLYVWDWTEDQMQFITNCSDCGSCFALQPTQAILTVLSESDDDEDEYDE